MDNRKLEEASGREAIGATRERELQIRSTRGTLVPVKVFEGVNAGDHPELAERLRAGNLNEVVLPGEERAIKPAIPVVYHDPTRPILALVLPESLRHEEFKYRRWMLSKLEQEKGEIPAYMRRFKTVFDVAELDTTEARGGTEAELEAHLNDREIKLANQQRYIEEMEEKFASERREYEELIEDLEKSVEEVSSGASQETQEELAKRKSELDAKWEELEQAQEDLERDRGQLEEVADRIERESQQVAETRQELESQRQELETRERQLQVRELNVEQRELEREKLGLGNAAPEVAAPTESTQVVTDDQFIEVVEAQPESEEKASSEQVSMGAKAMGRRRVEPTRRQLQEVATTEVDANTDEPLVVGASLPELAFVIDDAMVQALEDGEPDFLFQCQEIDGVPVISCTLASMDDEQHPLAAQTVVLDPGRPEVEQWLEAFESQLGVRAAVIHDEKLWKVYDVEGPWRSNIDWARQRWSNWSQQGDPSHYEEAAEHLKGDLELQVGSMKHPFSSRRFVDFEGASDVKLAVSIVGYWSRPEQLNYLVGRRSFSLSVLVGIQKRVVRQALHWGIDPGASLRQLAVDEAIILDETSLIERLLSNFAEVCVGLRPNDLDPLDQWENWESIIELAAERGLEPDPDVLELAERSLIRAEEYEAMMEAGVAPVEHEGVTDLIDLSPEEVSEARELEEEQWTYYMPAGVEDQMERLSESDGEALKRELYEAGRVEAAQLLLHREGEESLGEVVAAAEEMEAVELAALVRYLRGIDADEAMVEQLELAGSRGRFLILSALAPGADRATMEGLVDGLSEVDSGAQEEIYAQALIGGAHLEEVVDERMAEEGAQEEHLRVLKRLMAAGQSGSVDVDAEPAGIDG